MERGEARALLTRLAEQLADPGQPIPPQLSRASVVAALRLATEALGAARARRAGWAQIDGAARGNPGPAGIGVVLGEAGGTATEEIARPLGTATNNVAEYQALLTALERLRALGFTSAEIASDSELLVRQMRGEFRVTSPHLRRLHAAARRLAAAFAPFEIRHVPRAANARADALANRAIDEAGGRAG
jgi:ribonuclease HI